MRKTSPLVGILFLALSLPAFAAENTNNTNTSNAQTSASGTTSLQQVAQNPGNYIGKTMTLNGKVDRVLPSGDFIMKDQTSNQSILVFTVKSGAKTAAGANQQAGTAAMQLKPDQTVQVKGKLDELVVTNEYDVFNYKKNRENVDVTQTNTPVLLVRPSDIKKQG